MSTVSMPYELFKEFECAAAERDAARRDLAIANQGGLDLLYQIRKAVGWNDKTSLSILPRGVTDIVRNRDDLAAAINAVLDATRAYLPPDGISKDELINRVLAATDNPRIVAALAKAETAL